ncbi:amidase [Algihabitans albus]|uniref:amidase n=1 Tax=Algihabitans albus TaxID=2164067 RepID=UPI000E5D0709|nr:amidase [Algihabitans albus]
MTDPAQASHLSAAALGRQIAAGLYDAVDVCEVFLERIAAYGDSTVFIRVTPERARSEAAASRERHRAGRPLGPLDGVPVAWKDLFDMTGERTTAGSQLYREAPPAKVDAAAVSNLSAAGMVALGKVNLTEFAYSGLGLNPHFGSPRNPNDAITARVAGGSSSGSGVAVAAGLAPCSIGTDTGGSVRIPAALNGVVGLKTSERRIPKQGCFALSHTLDTVGPLARSVEDCILLDAALRGEIPGRFAQANLRGLRLVVPTNVVQEDLDEAVAANFERSLDRISEAGAKVEHRKLDLLEEVQRVAVDYGSLTAVEAYQVHYRHIESADVDAIDPRVVARILGGKTMSGRDVIEVQEARKRLAQELHVALAGALLVMPTCPHTAPEAAPLDEDQELFHRANLKTLRNTMIGNFLGTCGLAIPNGRDPLGLPTSILVSAPGGEDERLLTYGRAFERAVGAD